jgi:hypothetical protein
LSVYWAWQVVWVCLFRIFSIFKVYIYTQYRTCKIALWIFIFFITYYLHLIQAFVCMCDWGNQTTRIAMEISARSDRELAQHFQFQIPPCSRVPFFVFKVQACSSIYCGPVKRLAIPLFRMQASQKWGMLRQMHSPASRGQTVQVPLCCVSNDMLCSKCNNHIN